MTVLTLPEMINEITQYQSGINKECSVRMSKYKKGKEVEGAAKSGNIEDIIFFTKNLSDRNFTMATMDAAASNGHLEVVKWLHENRIEGCSSAMYYAALNGHLEVVKWLHENRNEGDILWAITIALAYSRQNIIDYLLPFVF